LMAMLNQSDGHGGIALTIDCTPDTELLRRALAGEWSYDVTRSGTVVKDLLLKPNHSAEDCGDAICAFAERVVGRWERDLRGDDDGDRRQTSGKSTLTPVSALANNPADLRG